MEEKRYYVNEDYPSESWEDILSLTTETARRILSDDEFIKWHKERNARFPEGHYVPLEYWFRDKIFVAVQDPDYNVFSDEYTGEHIKENYAFDTPAEFAEKWKSLEEGSWYWVFDKGKVVCSGALDPNDIELFEDYWGPSFDKQLTLETVEEYFDSINPDDYELGGVEITDDDFNTVLERVKNSDASLENVVDQYLKEIREVLDEGLEEPEDKLDLPDSVTITASQLTLDTDDIVEDEDELSDIISDYLSDTYGFCHYGFEFEVLYNEFNEPSSFVVSDIEWDVDEPEQDFEEIEPEDERKTFVYKSAYGDATVALTLNSYADNNNLYVGVEEYDKEYSYWSPFCDLTVNVGALPFLESAIDVTYSGQEKVNFLVENGFGELTGEKILSGFVYFPVFRFNAEKLKEIDPEFFGEYAKAHGREADVAPSLNDKIKNAEIVRGDASEKGSVVKDCHEGR